MSFAGRHLSISHLPSTVLAYKQYLVIESFKKMLMVYEYSNLFKLPSIAIFSIASTLILGSAALADYKPSGGEPPKGGGLTTAAVQIQDEFINR